MRRDDESRHDRDAVTADRGSAGASSPGGTWGLYPLVVPGDPLVHPDDADRLVAL
jgi:hypothetical protein